MAELSLIVDSIEKQYSTVKAVDRLSFNVRRGEIFALLGPNGSGKTTTVRMIAGIIRPDSGNIKILKPDLPGAKGNFIGYLPEDRGLYKEIPILRSLIYLGIINGLDEGSARQEAQKWLKKLGLYERRNDKFDTLSKGNQQKVHLISALIHQPDLALLDEPFSGLDPVNQEEFLEIIMELKKMGKTLIISAHQMNLVEKFADHVVLINRGKKLIEGSVEEIKNASQTRNKITITFSDISPELTEALILNAGAVDFVNSNTLHLYLNRETNISALFRFIPDSIEVLSIQSEELSLHDIYVSKVKQDREGK